MVSDLLRVTSTNSKETVRYRPTFFSRVGQTTSQFHAQFQLHLLPQKRGPGIYDYTYRPI